MKTRSALAAAILLSISGCAHDQEPLRSVIEVVGGIAYLGAEAFNLFMLVP